MKLKMDTNLHPFARANIKSIRQFSIVSNFCLGKTERINTNPCFSDYSSYPDQEHKILKLEYIKYLFKNYDNR